jgi:hypothetical protein
MGARSTAGPGRKRFAFALAICVVGTTMPRVVPAAEPTAAEIAAALELFQEGLRLEEKRDWSGALDRFRRVAAVKTTPQVRFHIALCLENLGKLVDALVEFQRAQRDAVETGATNVSTNAPKHISDLRERIPRVIVALPSGVSDPSVSIDGTTVAAALVGTAVPLDPGPHTLVVEAKGRRSFTKSFELTERAPPLTIDVELPEETDAGGPSPGPDPDRKGPKDEKPTRSALPFVVGGIGLAALAGGGVMYALRGSTITELEEACGPTRDRCPDDKRALADRGQTYTTVGNVLLGVGVVAVGAAVVLYVTGGPSKSSSSSARAMIQPTVGPGTFGLGLSGAF